MDLFKNTNIDFLGPRKIAYAISAFLMIASLVLMVYPGPKYGIDFMGGTNVIVRVANGVETAAVRDAVTAMGFDDAAVQAFGAVDSGQYLIETKAVSAVSTEDKQAIANAVIAHFGEGTTAEFDETTGDRIYVRLTEERWNGATTNPESTENIETQRAQVHANSLQGALVTAGYAGVRAEPFSGTSDRRLVVHPQGLQNVFEQGFRNALGDQFLSIDRVETVGPRVGQQLRDDGVKAVIFALVAILIYIAFRFDFRYAPAAVVALFHDVIVTMGIFVLLQREVNLPIIAAMLSIVGYSLDDTIVNFDRVRENLENNVGGKLSLYQIVNRSINETLSRTILTSTTTAAAILVLLFVGGEQTESFALAMLIGCIIGIYSTLYIASPLLIATSNYLDKRRQNQEAAAPTTEPAAPTAP